MGLVHLQRLICIILLQRFHVIHETLADTKSLDAGNVAEGLLLEGHNAAAHFFDNAILGAQGAHQQLGDEHGGRHGQHRQQYHGGIKIQHNGYCTQKTQYKGGNSRQEADNTLGNDAHIVVQSLQQVTAGVGG